MAILSKDRLQVYNAHPTDAYTQSTLTIVNFSAWVQEQSIMPYDGSTIYNESKSNFDSLKNTMMSWVNRLYPQVIDIFQELDLIDSQITNNLQTLIVASSQLKELEKKDELYNVIIENSKLSLNIVLTLKDKTKNLSNELMKFYEEFYLECSKIQISSNNMHIEINKKYAELNSLVAQLNSMKHATCPNKSAIASCEANIEQSKSVLDIFSKVDYLLKDTVCYSQNTIQAALYLGKFWKGFTDQCIQVAYMLKKAYEDPIVALEIDFQYALDAWKELINSSQLITCNVKNKW